MYASRGFSIILFGLEWFTWLFLPYHGRDLFGSIPLKRWLRFEEASHPDNSAIFLAVQGGPSIFRNIRGTIRFGAAANHEKTRSIRSSNASSIRLFERSSNPEIFGDD